MSGSFIFYDWVIVPKPALSALLQTDPAGWCGVVMQEDTHNMDKRILNLTKHCATPEQVADGVIEPSTETKEQILSLLTFDKIPTQKEIDNRANVIANITVKESDLMGGSVSVVMIGGAPYLMSILERVLIARDITPLYSFMKREAVAEKVTSCGVVKKYAFKHVGFVSVRL